MEERLKNIEDSLDKVLYWCNEFDEFIYQIYRYLYGKQKYDIVYEEDVE